MDFGILEFECLSISVFIHSTLYGVTNPVTQVTNLVTHEESLTLKEPMGGLDPGFGR